MRRTQGIWVLVAALYLMLTTGAYAQGAQLNPGLVLVADLPRDAEMVEDVTDDDGYYRQVLTVGEGAIGVTMARQGINDAYPMNMPAEDFLKQCLGLDELNGLEAIPVEPVAAYPTERLRFEAGENEDSSVVDAVLIRTDAYYFLFVAHTNADIYAGMVDGYDEGDVPALIDGWVESLGIFDPNEVDDPGTQQ